MSESGQQRTGPLRALRRFAKASRPSVERCELCSAPVAAGHSHLVDPQSRELRCACLACAVLFAGENRRWRRVDPRAEFLPDFRLTEAQWDALRVPIGLAWFFKSSAAGRVVAFYPGPAGATESLIALDTWEAIAAENPVLQALETDVEALLANRVGPAREHFRVSIDACYRLVGLLRLHWRGFSGGEQVWAEIERFFAALPEAAHA
ncbi:MAG: DUF5947 family protein [Myxococcales bacterium]